MIYLDHSATTPLDPEVARGVSERELSHFGNPSSKHPVGRAAWRLLEDARLRLADCIGASAAEEIVFTSGATEALGLALVGGSGTRPGRIAVSATEHAAVRQAALWLATHRGFEIDTIEVDEAGLVSEASLERALCRETRMVALMAANNEVGAVNDIARLARTVRRLLPKAKLVVDAVAAFGRVPLDVGRLDADFLAITAHKIHGPKGIGALWCRQPVEAILRGGGQERGMRGGTQPAALAWGFAEAACRHVQPEIASTLARLSLRLIAAVRSRLPDARLNGPAASPERICGNAHFCIPGLPSEPVHNALAEAGVCVSSGSACGSRDPNTFSHVLSAMGRKPGDGAFIRMTVGRFTTDDEIDSAASTLATVVADLRGIYNAPGSLR